MEIFSTIQNYRQGNELYFKLVTVAVIEKRHQQE